MNFVLLVNKTKNKTSRDMVNELNHIFDMKKIGHTGTLDPLATGILVMCGGRYTKLIDKLSFLEKEYITTIKVGIQTDTDDITGKVIKEAKCTYQKDELLKVLNSLVGEYNQVIPKYSAKKVNGKKLYEYARNNEEVPILTNKVFIKEMELLECLNDEIKIRLVVSKGTYIRSVIQTICNQLNIIGTMSELIRTKQGPFSLSDSYSIDDIKNNNYSFVDIEKTLGISVYELNKDEYLRAKNGNFITINSSSRELLLKYHDEYIAIYQLCDDYYKPEIML